RRHLRRVHLAAQAPTLRAAAEGQQRPLHLVACRRRAPGRRGAQALPPPPQGGARVNAPTTNGHSAAPPPQLPPEPPRPAEAPPPTVTLAQIAELAQVSLRTAKRWHQDGLIPGRCRLPSRVIRYGREAVLRWLGGDTAPAARRA